METLFLSRNSLAALPEGIFEGLAKLRNLYLQDNNFQALPGSGIFEGLANLRDLNLSSNGLRALSDDIFEGLTRLGILNLSSNDLRALPDGIFEDLANLRSLYLGNNHGSASFRPTADAGEDQNAELGTTVSLDGSVGGGPWGTNITYDWSVADGQGNPVTDLTLTGGDTTTPSFAIPETAPTSGYVFTLTVQGKGHRALGLYKSTDSMSVAVAETPTGDRRCARLGPGERYDLR